MKGFKSKRVISVIFSAVLIGFGLGNPATAPVLSQMGTDLICETIECTE